jgi:DNA-binding Lrp family transcriptional regulator
MSVKERITVSGKNLVEKVKELVRQGNIKRVRLIHEEKVLIDIPLSVGAPVAVVTVLAAPVLAALAAIAVLVKDCTIEIEKVEETDKNKK